MSNGGKRDGAGRKSFAPTAEQRSLVETLSGFGVPMEHIASQVKSGRGAISVVTLTKYFRSELDSGVVKANAKIAKTLFETAMTGNVTACIWWEKTRSGMSEKQQIEFPGEDGKPQKIPTMADFHKTVALARMPTDADAED
jgi:hypothetical protein